VQTRRCDLQRRNVDGRSDADRPERVREAGGGSRAGIVTTIPWQAAREARGPLSAFHRPDGSRTAIDKWQTPRLPICGPDMYFYRDLASSLLTHITICSERSLQTKPNIPEEPTTGSTTYLSFKAVEGSIFYCFFFKETIVKECDTRLITPRLTS